MDIAKSPKPLTAQEQAWRRAALAVLIAAAKEGMLGCDCYSRGTVPTGRYCPHVERDLGDHYAILFLTEFLRSHDWDAAYKYAVAGVIVDVRFGRLYYSKPALHVAKVDAGSKAKIKLMRERIADRQEACHVRDVRYYGRKPKQTRMGKPLYRKKNRLEDRESRNP